MYPMYPMYPIYRILSDVSDVGYPIYRRCPIFSISFLCIGVLFVFIYNTILQSKEKGEARIFHGYPPEQGFQK